MKRLRFALVVLLAMPLFVAACSSSREPSVYRSLSDLEVQRFLESKKEIRPTLVRDIGTETIVLYEAERTVDYQRIATVGCYEIAIDQYGDKAINSSEGPKDKPVAIQAHGVRTVNGKIAGPPLAAVFITDEKLLKTADKATVVFSDGFTVSEKMNRKGSAVAVRKHAKDARATIRSVTIYDRVEEKLFTEQF